MNIFGKKTMLAIKVNRNSVCMGDDCDDHRKTYNIDAKTTVSEFIYTLSNYLPQMKSVIWSVCSEDGICGYLITDEKGKATVELCVEDTDMAKAGISEIMCIYYYPSKFSYIYGETGERVNLYPECNTFLEKVKMASKTIL
ncbi:hypothetical protein ACWG0P_07800 [Amedibacillus sp. YH-ame6]